LSKMAALCRILPFFRPLFIEVAAPWSGYNSGE
jgi:hypothetical protein